MRRWTRRSACTEKQKKSFRIELSLLGLVNLFGAVTVFRSLHMDLTVNALLKHGFEPEEIVELVAALNAVSSHVDTNSASKRQEMLLRKYTTSLDQVRSELAAHLEMVLTKVG